MAYRYIKNIWAALKQLADAGIWHIADSGVPTDGTSGTGVDFTSRGSVYTNTADGVTYLNTGAASSPSWSTILTAQNALSQYPFSVVASGTNTSGTTTGVSISSTGVLPTDFVFLNWKTAAQTVAEIVATPTTNAITVTFVSGTAAQTVGTAGVLQYAVIRDL